MSFRPVKMRGKLLDRYQFLFFQECAINLLPSFVDVSLQM
jgi:hypothetical protein